MQASAHLMFVLLLASVARLDAADYLTQIKPLLAEKCSSCHGTLKQEAELRLDAARLIHQGSASGPVLRPGDAAGSELIARVSAQDDDVRMPPPGEGEPLTAAQITILSEWIDAGAAAPEEEDVLGDPREHWAYQLLRRPALPGSTDQRWTHPVDAFVSREHRRLGLQVNEVAEKATLVRRAYFDLVGLPPSRAELARFLDDTSADAWDRLVSELLERPQHGERWGRHWMDVWRYSDWDGYKEQLRGSQRHIWRWRDWIIESLNADKGYDQMVVEMLAGDEIAPQDPQTLRATGFLARNYHKSNRNIWLDATVEHTAKAFLGMTINCARCHDHKYDPIPQQDYYRFRAIFEPHKVRIDQVPTELDTMRDGLPRAYDADLEAKTFVFLQGNDKLPDEEHPVRAGPPLILGGTFEVTPVSLPVDAYFPALREEIAEARVTAARNTLAEAHLALINRQAPARNAAASDVVEPVALFEMRRRVAQLEVYALERRRDADHAKLAGSDRQAHYAQVAAALERDLAVQRARLAVSEKEFALQALIAREQPDSEQRSKALDQARQDLANARKAEAEIQKTQQKTAKPEYTSLGEQYPRESTGRRTALARWIVNPTNPLTARVAVNQIWMRHFGEPLVKNVFDFGLRSQRPAHADLLDWLAVELIEHDWSMKHLHHLILTSRTWRLRSSSSEARSPNLQIDPDNEFLWRANVRRLDAEIIRDNVLAVSGQLDATFGGPEIDYTLGEESRRRSVYLRHAYEKQMTMLVLFDAASPNECYRRSESIVPQQALALVNSGLSLTQSRRLARQLWKEVSSKSEPTERFVREAFLQVLSRPPSDAEFHACLEFVGAQTGLLSDDQNLTRFVGGNAPSVEPARDPVGRARENLVHVLMNHNDFVTVR